MLRRLCIGVASLALFAGGCTAFALDPAQPPGGNFDLSHWKLTLPDAGASEILPAQLTSGYTTNWFYTAPDGAMTFWCPVTGGTTGGSSYPRSELRERINPASDSTNWTGFGTHILSAECKVFQQPSSGKVIIGQIHGYNTNIPLVKLQFENGTMVVLVKNSPTGSTDAKYTFLNVGLSNRIAYEIRVVDGVALMTVNGVLRTHDFFATNALWTNVTFYFKAGSYVQDNSGATNEGGLVALNQLTVQHGAVPVGSPHFSDCGVDAAGNFTALLRGVAQSNYITQVSTDLANWTSVATNNSPTGVIAITDTNTHGTGRRFYRAKQR